MACYFLHVTDSSSFWPGRMHLLGNTGFPLSGKSKKLKLVRESQGNWSEVRESQGNWSEVREIVIRIYSSS